jgi:hypothetical protein
VVSAIELLIAMEEIKHSSKQWCRKARRRNQIGRPVASDSAIKGKTKNATLSTAQMPAVGPNELLLFLE